MEQLAVKYPKLLRQVHHSRSIFASADLKGYRNHNYHVMLLEEFMKLKGSSQRPVALLQPSINVWHK